MNKTIPPSPKDRQERGNIKTIKFSHRYYKMPDLSTYATRLIDVWRINYKELSPTFIDYDTTHSSGAYPLPKGELIVLFLKTSVSLWTTVRRWTPQKEVYYRSLIGQKLKVEINL